MAAEEPDGTQPLHERIDRLVETAAIGPLAPFCCDPDFDRRVYLDLTGAIPRVAEARAFLADEREGKRALLIDLLLESPAHATHLANTWRNIMPTCASWRNTVSPGVWTILNWSTKSMRGVPGGMQKPSGSST